MKLLLINSVCGIKSTGRIVSDIALEYEKKGWTVTVAFGRGNVPDSCKRFAVRIGNRFSEKLNALSCRLMDNDGFSAKRQTLAFLKWAEEFNPDVLWLHNLHGYYINIEFLFDWIKKRPEMQVKWTLHDCWSFTGHCCYFDFVKCYKWEKHCNNCPQKHSYPKSCFFDFSNKNFNKKMNSFRGVKNLEIITPSKWLADLVGRSFLGCYAVFVKNNSVDTNVFKPTNNVFRNTHGLDKNIIVLGVASPWSKRKGLDDFIKLSYMLPEPFKIVLVGLSKKQLLNIPSSIIGLEKTNSSTELADIYSSANVFLNLTYEDNYPTTNLESQACGTPCITYRTGGSVESVPQENIVDQGDLDKLCEVIKKYSTQFHK